MKRNAYDDMSKYEDHHWWFVSRRKIIKSALDTFLDNTSNNRILEIGCGSGGNLSLLNKYGNLFAVEYDDQAREAANRRNVCTVSAGALPNELPAYDPFDLVCALDVLEHIENDKLSIHSIEQLMKPGATLLITVPAFHFLWSRHDEVNDHKRRYTRKTLHALFKDTSLKIQYSSYYNSILFPGVLIARFINNIREKDLKFDIKMTSPVLNKILTNVFSLESCLLPKVSLPFGVSLLLIAKKTAIS